jgi:hypothetical protein
MSTCVLSTFCTARHARRMLIMDRLRIVSLRSLSSQKPEARDETSSAAPLANISRAVFTPIRSLTRKFSSKKDSTKSDKDQSAVDQSCTDSNGPVDEFGNKILYRGTQDLVVRLLFGASSFNFVYWTYYTASSYYYQDVVIQGIDMGGDVRWGAVGAFATGLMFYATKMFKDNACMVVYLAEGKGTDADRLGFQMHNFLGGPGRRVEASVGNVRILGEGATTSRFGSSFIPLRVKGMGKNVLIDDKGQFYYNNTLRDILHEQGILSAEASVSEDDDDANFIGNLDSKAKRMAYKPSTSRRKGRK